MSVPTHPEHRDPAATALIVAGGATLASSLVMLLLTYWFLLSFVWLATAAVGAWQIAVARRLGDADSDPTDRERAARWGAIAAIAALNPLAYAACRRALRPTNG